MDHELILKYLSTLGFPVCMAIGFAYALWKIGARLLDSHMQLVTDLKANSQSNTDLMRQIEAASSTMVLELKSQTASIDKMTEILESPSTLFSEVCRAEHKKPRGQ